MAKTSSISSLGEFGFIDEISKNYAGAPLPLGWLGIGDDCAVIPKDTENSWLITTDMLLGSVHFLPDLIPPRSLGYKSLAVSLSDIAAMGGTARAAFLSLAMPKNTDDTWAREFMQGFSDLAAAENVSLLGGDTTASKNDICINVAMMGEAPNMSIKLRSSAHAGDIVVVSRPLGASAAGFNMMLNQKLENSAAIRAHHEPVAETRLGAWLGAQNDVHAMMDISDGLLQDLSHILRASSAGARLDITGALIHPAASLEQALSGGEDYALLFTVAPDAFAKLVSNTKKELGRDLIAIGTLTPDAGEYDVFHHGKRVKITKLGFDHFA